MVFLGAVMLREMEGILLWWVGWRMEGVGRDA
jgi:hypothetical protein